jgi:hypothetical protein
MKQINLFTARFKEYYENINFNYLYNIDYLNNIKNTIEELYDFEYKFNSLFEI